MKLLIISNMSHYQENGRLVGWGPTVQEINHLANLFDEITHIGCLHYEKPPASSLPYESSKIHFIPVSPAGGKRLLDKIEILFRIPDYIRTIRKEMPKADVIHVRCPANISLIAILLLAFTKIRAKRWVKYAGNWNPVGQQEPWSYRFQRWFLRHGFHRGVVTVNGNWPGEPEFVHAFPNPCLTTEELIRAREIVSQKQLSDPIRIVFSGRLEEEKGVGRCLQILQQVKKRNVNATLDLVGNGPALESFQQMAESLGVSDSTHFHGWIPRTELASIYSTGHIFLFPSACSEGWPKVLSEAMGYGMVPIASNVSSIPYHLQQFCCGMFFKPHDIEGFVSAIISYRENPEVWRDHSFSGSQAAEFFTYENYLTKVSNLLKLSHHEAIAVPRTV